MAENHRIKTVVEEVTSKPPLDSQMPQPNPEHQAKKLIEELNKSKPHSDKSPKKTSSNKKTSLKLIFFITILTAIVVGFVAGGVYVYFSGVSKIGGRQSTPSPSPSVSPTPTPPSKIPEPSPTPAVDETIDYSAYKVNVTNGSGKIGEASKVTDLLKKEGFKSVSTGNADRYDYQKTIIQSTKNVPESVIKIISELLEESNYSTDLGSTLTSSSKYDIVVTVGSKTT